jgi:hypothetical protein
MSGWRVSCPACGAEYLLPEPFAHAGARVRCPGCGAAFRAADPRQTRALRDAVAAWASAQPGGIDAVRAARAGGTFWQTHGASLSTALEPKGDDGPANDAAALEAALSSLFGAGPRLL